MLIWSFSIILKLIMFFFLTFFSLSEQLPHFFPRGIGYITVNSTEAPSHVIPSSFFGNVIFAVVSASDHSKISLQSQTEIITKPIIAGANTQIVVEFDQGYDESVTIAFAELSNLNCDQVIVSTEEKSTIKLAPLQNEDICVLYSPKGSFLQYNVIKSNVNTKTDSLTIYREKTRGAWYDRYETISEPSGWSAISSTPWFFRLKGSSEAKVELQMRAKLDVSLNVLTYQEFAENTKSQKLSVLQHDVFIPIIGCVAPTVLIFAWILAYYRLSKKGDNSF
ncbi:hypothetical protein TRFO_34912 [Tritrichomonas foetus]|uniref:Uncharacterized protein n=1 Tax=Tritrichomonas foetus TaxID=1144522 RepID=A0A1J4JHN0_9EUKA|nr:hypothetical protein TRFO_34912 [Tritrichomonas foetus]|eukprot:OHS98656.1 hypothetical protein TRFO_34912 [Tritrichomonas foetus]